MKILILDAAEEYLIAAYRFYERQSPGLGDYFLDSLFSDIDSLRFYAGIHAKHLTRILQICGLVCQVVNKEKHCKCSSISSEAFL